MDEYMYDWNMMLWYSITFALMLVINISCGGGEIVALYDQLKYL